MRTKVNENWLLTNSKFIQQKEYWVNKLTGDMPPTTLIFDNNIGNLPAPNTKEKFDISLPPHLGIKLIKLCKASDMSIYILLLTGLKVLIHNYTENKDITVTSPVCMHGISRETFNDYLLICDTLWGEMTFKEAIIHIRQSVLEAYQNQDYPFDKLISFMAKAGKIPVDHSNSFIKCIFTNIHDENVIHDVNKENETLVFSFQRKENRIYGDILYDPNIYERFYTKQIATHFIRILEHSIDNINVKIGNVPIFSEQEKQRLIDDFNSTKSMEFSMDKRIHGLLEAQVKKTPDNIALIDKYHSLTYRELDERANSAAHLLQKKGIQADFVVGILDKRSIKTIVDILAVLKADGAYLPISPDYPEERKQYMLADSKARILLTGGDLIEESTVQVVPATQKEYSSFTRPPLAYIIYTSGSTGKPKGVMVEQQNLLDYIHWFIHTFKIDSRDIVLQQSIISFDVSVEEIFPALLKGGRLVIIPKEALIDRNNFGEIIRREQVTIISVTPLLLKEINKIDGIILRSLRMIISGGDVLKSRFINNLVQDKILYNIYGPTETTISASFYRCSSGDKGDISIGKPIANTGIYILKKNYDLLPVNVPGELYINGKGVARGYLNRPELTSEKFVADPFLKGERLYRTGDLAKRLPDGNIQFMGRVDQQIKIRGYRIELGEIESRLLEQKNIKDAVVIIQEMEKDDKYICAYIVADGEMMESEIREELEGQLPHYFIPTYFIQLEKIPLTPNGKIDKCNLPGHGTTLTTKYAAPRNQMETRLVEVWAEALEIEKEPIGIDSNFFQMGGHSLKVTILVAKIHKEFNIKISLLEIFKMPTIRALGDYIGKQGKEKSPYEEINSVEKREYYPLSSAQQRLYFLQQMDLDNTNYNMFLIIPLEPGIHKEILAKAFKKLIVRHEGLRTSFAMINGQAVQVIHPKVEFSLQYDQHAPARDKTVASSREIPRPQSIVGHIKDFVLPFNLTRAPLLRARLIKAGEKQDLLLVDTHHIITDGISNDILTREFKALASGKELQPLRLQYKDFAQYQQGMQVKDTQKRQEAYWLKEFSGDLPVLNMPTDYSRPMIRNFEGNQVSFEINEELTKALRQIAETKNVTLYMILLAVYYILLAKLSGQNDIILGTFTSGRRHASLEKIVGMLVNTIPLRNFPEGEKTFSAFLSEVRERTLTAFENQDYQLDDLVSKIPVGREMDRHPIFDVVFDMHLTDGTKNEESKGVRKKQNPDKEKMNPGKEYGTSKFDIIFVAIEMQNEIKLIIEYSTRLYKQETITKFLKSYQEIIKYITGDINIKIKDIKVCAQGERETQTGIETDKGNANIEFDL